MRRLKKILLIIIGIELSACGLTDDYCSTPNLEQLFLNYLSVQITTILNKQNPIKDKKSVEALNAKVANLLALVDLDIDEVKTLNKDTSKRTGQCTANLKVSVPPPLLEDIDDYRLKLKEGLFSQYAKELGIENKENSFSQPINYVVNVSVNPQESHVKYDSYAWERLFAQLFVSVTDIPVLNNLRPTVERDIQTLNKTEIKDTKLSVEAVDMPSTDLISDNRNQNNAPSFDCNKASTPTDKIICVTNALAVLDVKNMALYKQAKLIDFNKTKLIRQESIKYKYACGSDVDCISRIYQKTISLYGCVIKNAICQDDIVF